MVKDRRITRRTVIIILCIALALSSTVLLNTHHLVFLILFIVSSIVVIVLTSYLYYTESSLIIDHDRLIVSQGLIQTEVISFERIVNCERFFHTPAALDLIFDPIDYINFTKSIFGGMSWLAVHLVNGDTRIIPVKDPIESLNVITTAIEVYKREHHGLPEG